LWSALETPFKESPGGGTDGGPARFTAIPNSNWRVSRTRIMTTKVINVTRRFDDIACILTPQ
jgi:hypothetical protein